MMARVIIEPLPWPQERPQQPPRGSRRWMRPAPPRRPVASLLAALPSLPRPVLSRLTTALIDRMDEIDADPDLEDSHDREDTYD